VDIRDVTERLDASVPLVEQELDRRLKGLRQSVNASGAIRDAMERAIDALDDESAREELRRCLTELDCRLEDISDDAQAITAYDLFDPIRILSADLKAESRPRALW
jgi:hypothetical protein